MFIDNAKYKWNDLKWMNVDLPNLTSITSEGSSFDNPRSVTLESISDHWIWSYLDIPNLRNVKISNNSFKKVHHPIVNSTILYCVLNIDVSGLLFPKVYYFDFIQSIDSSITSIIIPNWTCNDIDYTLFDFSRFNIVESIEIADDCFGSVETFKIEGLNRLKTIKIGKKSFTKKKNGSGDNKSKSFRILNCESLESIQIGGYSFSDFAGGFELKNLPQLQSIQFDGCNFCGNSFVIRGIEQILNIVMIRSSKSTNHYFG